MNFCSAPKPTQSKLAFPMKRAPIELECQAAVLVHMIGDTFLSSFRCENPFSFKQEKSPFREKHKQCKASRQDQKGEGSQLDPSPNFHAGVTDLCERVHPPLLFHKEKIHFPCLGAPKPTKRNVSPALQDSCLDSPILTYVPGKAVWRALPPRNR